MRYLWVVTSNTFLGGIAITEDVIRIIAQVFKTKLKY